MTLRRLYSADGRDFVMQTMPRSLLSTNPAVRLEQLLTLYRRKFITKRQLRKLVEMAEH